MHRARQRSRISLPSSLVGTLALALGLATPGRADDPPAPDDAEAIAAPVMSAEEAARGFRGVPEGFRVGVFAAEPLVRNPIACAWDGRGRLWVAENYTYATPDVQFAPGLRDRVLILEDTDGDGRADRRTVFTDQVRHLTSVEVGRGGVWLMCPPELLFLPDRDRDDRPDGPARVVLDGFTVPPENHHNFANGLRWGPDGWLYGRCGASAPGRVGVPGTPDEARIPNTGGLWRFHPERKTFEMLAHGTTNPWGHDWNALGEAFFINTVNGHLWHAVAGMHFVRVHTINASPRVYQAIDQHADHWHWDNRQDWTKSRDTSGIHGQLGGGHAHSGMTIYLGDQWPAEWRGALLTLNLHGRRVNVDRLERAGSGYVGRHDADRFFSADPWFRGIDLTYGPDGAVYVLDWSDTGECHDSTGVQRSTGRIFRIAYGAAKPPAAFDLDAESYEQLVARITGRGEWFARMARRVIVDRVMAAATAPRDPNHADLPIYVPHPPAVARLRDVVTSSPDPALALRALWALHVTAGTGPDLNERLLAHPHEAVRAWAVRLLLDHRPLDTAEARRPPGAVDEPIRSDHLAALVDRATNDESGLVRLVLASSLQRLPVAQRPALAAALMAHAEDAHDHNLPLLIWYGLIPLADADPQALARLGADCALPTTRRFIARRLAEQVASDAAPLDALLARATERGDAAFAADVLAGVADGLRGWRKAPRPAAWEGLVERFGSSPRPESLAALVRELGVVFGDGRALGEVRALALDPEADLDARRAALQALLDASAPEARAVAEKLLDTRFLNSTAARGLARFDDPVIARALADRYRAFHPSERGAVVDALASRPAWAAVLLDRVAAGAIPRAAVTAFHARQIRAMSDPVLEAKLAEAWGAARETPADRRAAIARWRQALTPEALAQADPAHGRDIFARTCATCHRLYGEGQTIGPDLTGSGRDNLDYLLENILDPGATVTADFRMSVVATTDGRVLSGIVKDQTPRTLTLQTQEEAIPLERDAIDELRPTDASLMPDGLLDPLGADEVRDLFGYLMTRTPPPAAR